MTENYCFSQLVTIFHDKHLPEEEVLLAGYTALIEAYKLGVPVPDTLSAISKKHKNYQKEGWTMFSPRYTPQETLYGQLIFAFKYEGINLSILKALFEKIDREEVIKIVKQEPTSVYSRRIWFLYEWLQEEQLELADATKGRLVNVLDEKLQYPGKAKLSKRHRVYNNLPGVPAFCPIIRKTETLEAFIAMNLSNKAHEAIAAIHPDVLMRAAAFMLLKDSKASFAIEQETPTQIRAERWGQAIGQAGAHELSHDEFIRLQQIIISDFRFTHLGYRNEGGFVGEHERSTGMPIPEHISARWQDLYSLMEGLIEADHHLKNSDIDAVLAAAIIAFGFVFIHPFEDGNGRLHRYLIHHVLAEKQFSPANIVFPVSAVIYSRIQQYKKSLEAYSRPLLKLIKWHPTEKYNVDVLNNTINYYRYFDATQQAEFLYECIKLTLEQTLPEEIDYLKKYDEMKNFIKNNIEMPDRMIDLLIRFLCQENGVLSKRARQKEFRSLTDNEIAMLEERYGEVFRLR